MRLAIKRIIPNHEIRRDFIEAIKSRMLRDMGAELLERHEHLVRQSRSFDGGIELNFELTVMAAGELEAIKSYHQAKLERAIQEAKPKVVDDFGNEVTL